MTQEKKYHKPVLLKESVDALNIQPDGVYVDVTFGGGGHSREILSRLGSEGRLVAFDQDEDALQNKIEDERFILIHQNFQYMRRFLRFHKFEKVDGILADLGVSSHQFDKAERGFSNRFEAKLDMRMDASRKLSAFEVLNEYDEKKLTIVLKMYGELRQAPAMAREIVHKRKENPLETTGQLREVLKRFLPSHRENKILAQFYQAIRIEVNQELEVLRSFLGQTSQMLRKGGRLSVISYHSLEDRLVKRYMRDGKFEGQPEKDVYGRVEVPFKRVGRFIIPDEKEIQNNSRARSAILRIAEKL